MTDTEIVYVDKDYRRRFIIYFSLIVIITSLFLFYVDYKIDQASSRQSVEDMFYFTKLLGITYVIGSLFTGILWLNLGYKTLKNAQFPPPGMKVLKDTKIKKGRPAKTMAMTLLLGGILMIILPILSYWYLHQVIDITYKTRQLIYGITLDRK